MTVRKRSILVTLAVAVPAFALTPTLFPPSPDMAPTAAQAPLFIGLGAVYSLALGAGVEFLIHGRAAVNRLIPDAPRRQLVAYLSIAWLLVSWYPHGGFHANNGMDTGRLLWIEYGFHLPLIAAPLALIWSVRVRPGDRRPANPEADVAGTTPPAYQSAARPG